MKKKKIKLTKYSHGAGCGCKIAPDVLEKILKEKKKTFNFPNLLVGNDTKDDAAVLDLGNNKALISTTDFFMPIVDDPYNFGRIAATNSISDVYAMGGTPCLAISILGWPINKLSADVARQVINGARSVCLKVGIPLAGGHSIDSPEPIFGLAVNGLVDVNKIKRNDSAQKGDIFFLTKPLGVGILTSAEKHGILRKKDKGKATSLMTTLNSIGAKLAEKNCISAMTDVTGFGLLGHTLEMADASGFKANIWINKVPVIEDIEYYLDKDCCPGGTFRNIRSYGHRIKGLTQENQKILADPQTSGGLLVAVPRKKVELYLKIVRQEGLPLCAQKPLGEFTKGRGIEIV